MSPPFSHPRAQMQVNNPSRMSSSQLVEQIGTVTQTTHSSHQKTKIGLGKSKTYLKELTYSGVSPWSISTTSFNNSIPPSSFPQFLQEAPRQGGLRQYSRRCISKNRARLAAALPKSSHAGQDEGPKPWVRLRKRNQLLDCTWEI